LYDRRRDGGTNSTLRTKKQGTHLTLNEHNDDDDDDDDDDMTSCTKINLQFYKSRFLYTFTCGSDFTSQRCKSRCLICAQNDNGYSL